MSIQPTTQQLEREASSAYQQEQYNLAAQKFEALIREYSLAGNPLMAAEMANNRSVALLKAGDARAAYEAARDTDQVFAQAGDIRRQAIALGNQASALEVLKKYGQAAELYRQSADLLKQIGELDMRAVVLKSLSYLQFQHGSKFEAMATMNAALQSQTRLSFRDRVLKSLLNTLFRLLGGR